MQHVHAAPLLGGPRAPRYAGLMLDGNKNPPQQTERAGTERLEQRKRLEREEASTDGLCCD